MTNALREQYLINAINRKKEKTVILSTMVRLLYILVNLLLDEIIITSQVTHKNLAGYI